MHLQHWDATKPVVNLLLSLRIDLIIDETDLVRQFRATFCLAQSTHRRHGWRQAGIVAIFCIG